MNGREAEAERNQRIRNSLHRDLRERQQGYRAKALKLLGVIGGNDAEKVLIDALSDQDVYLRGTAVMAMAELGTANVIPSLEKLEAEAGVQFARAEGILPAPEANHAVAGAMREAVKCREEGVSRGIRLVHAA